jgi:amidase
MIDTPANLKTQLSRRTALAGGLSILATSVSGLMAQDRKVADKDELHFLSLMELAKRIRSRELSPVEITQAQLARIESLDSKLNAYVCVMREQALAQARKAETEIAAGHYKGPLHGVPVAVKDLFFTRGVATKGGGSVLANFVPTYDATVVSRLSQAGAVLLGKLCMTEGAMLGYHRDYKVPRNPWGARLWPGASSSGCGVATAAGLCYASLGTDTGGSIRMPAAMNGIVGLKPTWGRVSRYGVLETAGSLDHVGTMTRNVADAAAVLSVIAGPDVNDPTSLDAPAPDYLTGLNSGIKGLRLGFDEDYATQGVRPYMADAVRHAVQALEKLGARIMPVKMPKMTEPELSALMKLVSVESLAANKATFPSHADNYGSYFRQFLEMAQRVTAANYESAKLVRQEYVVKLSQVFQDIDILALPTLPTEAFPYNVENAYEGFNMATRTIAGVDLAFLERRFLLPFSYSGYPTLSLPCGTSPGGLPLSLQLAGRPLSEAMLCRIGQAYESATEWRQLHPPV